MNTVSSSSNNEQLTRTSLFANSYAQKIQTSITGNSFTGTNGFVCCSTLSWRHQITVELFLATPTFDNLSIRSFVLLTFRRHFNFRPLDLLSFWLFPPTDCRSTVCPFDRCRVLGQEKAGQAQSGPETVLLHWSLWKSSDGSVVWFLGRSKQTGKKSSALRRLGYTFTTEQNSRKRPWMKTVDYR